MSHVKQLSTAGLTYLQNLELHDLCQLKSELDTLWSQGHSPISNQIYDKIADGITYELNLLKADPYNYVVRKKDQDIKTMLDYFTQLYNQGQPMVDNAVWDILNRECALRQAMGTTPTVTLPSHWTSMSLEELPIQFIPVSSSSQEFRDLATYFIQSLGKSSTVIYSITRIQNLRLWSVFQALEKIIPSNTCRRLIHGTASPTHQRLVMHHGFVSSFCPGGLIGNGIYFAVNASYSDAPPYVLKKTPQRRELFVCKVLLGGSSQGRTGISSTNTSAGIHSVFHHQNERCNDMFCIFNPYQAYPEYIVQYDYV